ncbi:hypothetical protein BH10ACI2_BH10ACI2_02110 [soil metagenome]
MTLTIEIKDTKKKSLEAMAIEDGKGINQFVAEIIDDYLDKNNTERRELRRIMTLSEPSFEEWNNEEDAIYDTL